MITAIDKKTLRKDALKLRSQMADSGAIKIKSNKIVSKILNSHEFQNAKHIAIYLPIKNEIDIRELLKIKNKNFYIPRCNDLDLEFCLYKGLDFLKTGAFGILEPINESVSPDILDIVYIPALMANNKNYRLGYGKGYYDRFFAKNNTKAKKIIVIAREFYSDAFLQEDFDVPADNVLFD